MEPAAHSPEYRRKQLVLLAAFQSTYSDTTTPLTPDMVPLVIDTGASVTITPFQTDFITPLQPVQQTTIQGIASGLQVACRWLARAPFATPSETMMASSRLLKFHPACMSRNVLCAYCVHDRLGP